MLTSEILQTNPGNLRGTTTVNMDVIISIDIKSRKKYMSHGRPLENF